MFIGNAGIQWRSIRRLWFFFAVSKQIPIVYSADRGRAEINIEPTTINATIQQLYSVTDLISAKLTGKLSISAYNTVYKDNHEKVRKLLKGVSGYIFLSLQTLKTALLQKSLKTVLLLIPTFHAQMMYGKVRKWRLKKLRKKYVEVRKCKTPPLGRTIF